MSVECFKEILFTNEEIVERCKELGKEISTEYANKNLLIIGLLKGCIPFMAELVKHITCDMEMDFMAVSSYGHETVSSGDVRILKDLDRSVKGYDVIIAEDIIDTGRTLKVVKELLMSRGASSVKIACMLDKKERRVVEIEPDLVCFEIPDVFVVGFGLDFRQKMRNVPFVGVVKEEYYK